MSDNSFTNAKQLRDFLNQHSDYELESSYIVVVRSDDVEFGSVHAGFFKDGDENPYLDIVGCSE